MNRMDRDDGFFMWDRLQLRVYDDFCIAAFRFRCVCLVRAYVENALGDSPERC